jgi:ATP-binding cassette subfamily B (MDR/TAP) protein 9
MLQIALVGQEPVLYARSVKENIAYGLEEWKMEDVEAAARLANAHDFITELADKYDTETGEKGMQLSGTCNSQTQIVQL